MAGSWRTDSPEMASAPPWCGISPLGIAGVAVAGAGFTWWGANIPAEARALIFPADGLLRTTHLLGLIALGLLAVLLVAVGFLAPRAFGLTAGILAVVLTAPTSAPTSGSVKAAGSRISFTGTCTATASGWTRSIG